MNDAHKELVKRLNSCRILLLYADGDRDLGFQSNITTDTSMALAHELNSAIVALEALASEVKLLRDAGALVQARAELLRAALEVAREAAIERRGYCEHWEWKYKAQWDEEDAAIGKALEDKE